MKRLGIVLGLVVLLTTGIGCGGGGTSAPVENLTLEYWRVFDDEDSFDDIINAYEAQHSNVRINYTKLRYDELEDELLQAFAEGRGPDIFSIHNTWMGAYKELMMAMPSHVTTSVQQVQGTLRKETVTVTKTEPTMSTRELSTSFASQVEEDVVLETETSEGSADLIYGLPLSLDTLALFYNRDLLDASGIANPPSTWTDFHSQVETITQYDDEGGILQSAAGLGSSGNVERGVDVLSLLMMQNGTLMTDDRGRVSFHTIPEDAPEGVFPGVDATRFYTDFANPTKSVYTWNSNMANSFDAFANGETAFFLGYSYHTPLIRTVAPKLNFDVTHVPQISGGQEVNFANYWVEVVSKDTEYEDWAWDFVLFAADEENVGTYLDSAGKPTALRNLIATQLDDTEMSIFAEQVLSARSWYHGVDVHAAEDAIEELIDTILAGGVEEDEAIGIAASKVSQTY